MVMTKEQIEGYIKGSIESGISTADIKNNLVMLGVGPSDVDVYLNKTQAPMMPNMEPINPIPPTPSFQGMPKPPVLPTHKKSKLIKLFASFIFVFLILAGGAYAYLGFVISPGSVTSRALDEFITADSMSFESLIKIGDVEGMPEEFQGSENKILYSGSFNSKDPENFKALLNLSFAFNGIAASLEARVLDNKLYGKLLKAPEIFMLSGLSSYENKWYFTELGEEFKRNIMSPSLSSFVKGDTLLKDDMSEEDKKEIYEIFRQAKFIKITKKEPPTVKDSMLMHHMIFEPDYEGMLAYLKEIIKYAEKKQESSIEGFDIDSFEVDFRESIKAIKNFSGEIWVDAVSGLPYKVTTEFDVSYSDGLDFSSHVSTESLFSDWNKDISIEAPEGALDFKEIPEWNPWSNTNYEDNLEVVPVEEEMVDF